MNQKAYSGWVVTVPSTRRTDGEIPTTPPQVRVPTTGPRPSWRKAWVKMSPSEPAHSSASATSGPAGASSGYSSGACQREIPSPRRRIARRGINSPET